ncbi:MAG: hypothetical protein H6551_08455 [Chitinophagales bacterium]|nr:hypothetical protein [Chitinophagaceae bacterium]MCB9065154.1 hypothetical protein [Chitinophagales bacterium]
MLKRVLFTVCFCLSLLQGYAQELRDPNYYYALSAVSQDAKDCYAKLFDINSSARAFSILDSMFTVNKATQPFYIYLACTMLPEATGELRAQLNIVCRHLIEQDPTALTNVLFSKNSLVKSRYRQYWAHRVGVEIRVTCESDPLDCFKRSRNRALSNCNEASKDRLELLYNMIRQEMNLYRQR